MYTLEQLLVLLGEPVEHQSPLLAQKELGVALVAQRILFLVKPQLELGLETRLSRHLALVDQLVLQANLPHQLCV
jgi:hypothetical protein